MCKGNDVQEGAGRSCVQRLEADNGALECRDVA